MRRPAIRLSSASPPRSTTADQMNPAAKSRSSGTPARSARSTESAADASQAAQTIGGIRSDAGITITTTINPAHAAIAGHGCSPDAPIATRLVPNAPATTSSASGRLRSIARAIKASRRASTARSTPGRPGRPSSRPANLAASRTRTGKDSTTRSGPSTAKARPERVLGPAPHLARRDLDHPSERPGADAGQPYAAC